MQKALIPLLVIALFGCDRILQRTVRRLDQAPASYMVALDAAVAVLSRHFTVTHVDKTHGVVLASSLVRANIATKYRTRVVARVYQVAESLYDAEIRVTNEMEVSQPSLLGGGQPPHDWRAVGFDHVLEANLMSEYQAYRAGRPAGPPITPTHVMFRPTRTAPMRHRDLPRPEASRPAAPPPAARAVPAQASPPAAAPKPQEAPAKERRQHLFVQYISLGDKYLERRDMDKALLEYQRAAVSCPASPVGHLSLAGVWTELRRYSAAATSLRQAAAAAHGRPLPRTDLGRLRGPDADVVQRLLLLKGWCKQRPDDHDARLLLAYHYYLGGRADEARAAIEPLIRATPDDVAAQYLAQQMEAVQS